LRVAQYQVSEIENSAIQDEGWSRVPKQKRPMEKLQRAVKQSQHRAYIPGHQRQTADDLTAKMKARRISKKNETLRTELETVCRKVKRWQGLKLIEAATR
jgi:2-methylcitrate dehydratase PrpD